MASGDRRGILSRRILPVLAALWLSGCAVKFSQRSPWDIQQIHALSEQLEQFRTLAQLKAEEAESLRHAKAQLDKRLTSSDISVGFDERGLIVRVLDTVLFDSGVRSGEHIVKALSLGASAVAIGRPYAYGLCLLNTFLRVHTTRDLHF